MPVLGINQDKYYQKIIKVKIRWAFLFPKHYILWLGEIPLHNVPSRYTQKKFCTM